MNKTYQISSSIPKNQKLKQAAGVFCSVDNRFLLVQRAHHVPQGGTWCLPGGKVETNESYQDAAIREMQEETGIKLEKDKISAVGSFHISHELASFVFHIFFYAFDERPSVILSENENIDFRWITLEEAMDYNLILAAKEILSACDSFAARVSAN